MSDPIKNLPWETEQVQTFAVATWTVLTGYVKHVPDAMLASLGSVLTFARGKIDASLDLVKAELRHRHPNIISRMEIRGSDGKVCVLSPGIAVPRLRSDIPPDVRAGLYDEHPEMFDSQGRLKSNMQEFIVAMSISDQNRILSLVDMEEGISRIAFGVTETQAH